MLNMQTREESLKREIGIWGLSAHLINIMVGAGIFVLPAIVADGLGPAGILAYLLCGVMVGLAMLCFAEVGSKITNSGGAYSYIEVAFGKYPGFLTTNLFVWACITADAAVANALADILASLIPFFTHTMVRIIFFVLLFSGLAYINVIGVKQGIRLIKINTIAKLLPLLLLILIGWTQISLNNLAWDIQPTINKLGEISLVLFFAFIGAESGLTVGGEVKNPKKTIPKSILVSISSVVVLYLLIQITAQGIMGSSLSGFKQNPLGEVAKQVFGPVGMSLMILGAAISMFGNISGKMLSMPRVIFGSASDDVIPRRFLSKVHRTYATPYFAILLYAGLSFLLSSLGGFKQLAILSSASMLLIYLGVACSVIKLRQNQELNPGSFIIPGGYLVPIATIIIIVWLLSNLSKQEQFGVLVFILLLTVIYFLRKFLKSQKTHQGL